MEKIQAAILAGGFGTRLGHITRKKPKALVEVGGSPFISHLLLQLNSLGVENAVLLTGYRHGMLRDYCGDGKKWGVKLRYSRETKPLGTGGALLLAKRKLKGTTLVLNGDSYMPLPLAKMMDAHRKNGAWATILCMRGELAARGAIDLDGKGMVREFGEKGKTGIGYFNTGAYLIGEKALELLAKLKRRGELLSVEKSLFPLLATRKKLFAYKGIGPFEDMGTHEGLARAHSVMGGAIFLDRDGVINRNRKNYVLKVSDFKFEGRALSGMKKLSGFGMPIFVVTNQSAIGRGIASMKEVDMVHGRMLSEFMREGIRVKDVFVCPHAPSIKCKCRKPKIGMLLQAKRKYGVNLSASVVIGDATSDIEMGKRAGCKTILVKTGHGGKDGKHKVKSDFVAKDLEDAAGKLQRLLSAGK